MSDTEFTKKWAKVIAELPEFKDIADAADNEGLNSIILQSEKNIFTVEEEKDKDDKLNAARELCKEYAAPYRDAIKVQMAKIKYALYLLSARGVNMEKSDEN